MSTLKVELTNEDLACWMAINNTFTNQQRRSGDAQYEPEKVYWNGILFQLGKYHSVEDGDLMNKLDKIELLGGGKTREYFEAPPKTGDPSVSRGVWINAFAKDSRPTPMTVADLEKLYLDSPKTLHHYLVPYPGGITVWHRRPGDGELALTAKALNAPGSTYHNSYRFEFENDAGFVVSAWTRDEGGNFVEDLKLDFPVETIRIVEKRAVPMGSHQNPPQRP